MMKTTATIAIAAALGGGCAAGISACGGEDRSGDVQFEGETTSTTPGPMPGAPTTATETTPTGGEFLTPTESETTRTETTP